MNTATFRAQQAAQAFGFRVHTLDPQAGDAGPAAELCGRWWWTLTRPGWSGIETDPDDHATEAEAWAAAIAAHVSGEFA